MTQESPSRTPRFHFRLGTLLLVIAILALLLVVSVQQVQLERLRQRADALQKQVDQDAKDKDFLTTLVREFRDKLERSSSGPGSTGGATAAREHR
jgi:cell division protein FtsB